MVSDARSLILLAIETTCDETGAAVLEGAQAPLSGVPRILSSVVSSQARLHERFGGVVPEVASRAHLGQVLPMVDLALRSAGVSLADVGAVAVATKPGLVGALVVGLTAAKSLALALGVPLVAVDHLEGHLYACQLANPEATVYPCLGLVVSGGHTSLFHCHSPLEHELIGGTTDDAAGEAFDKVASLLGLGYPGGPLIEKVAREGNPAAFAFPRSFQHDERLLLSFSGLKTAVLYTLRGQNCQEIGKLIDRSTIADVAASFQEAVIDVIVTKTRQALRQTGLRRLGIGGGVAANARFRERIGIMAAKERVELFIPPPALCTDNAAMAAIAIPKLAAGQVTGLDVDVTCWARPPKSTPRLSVLRLADTDAPTDSARRSGVVDPGYSLVVGLCKAEPSSTLSKFAGAAGGHRRRGGSLGLKSQWQSEPFSSRVDRPIMSTKIAQNGKLVRLTSDRAGLGAMGNVARQIERAQ